MSELSNKRYPDKVDQRDFNKIIKKEINRPSTSYFTISMMKVNITHDLSKNKAAIIHKDISDLIFSHFVSTSYSFCFDEESSFFFIFPETGYHESYIFLNNIIPKIENKFGIIIDLIISLAEYPQDGETFNELIHTLAFNSQNNDDAKKTISDKLIANLFNPKDNLKQTVTSEKKTLYKESEKLFKKLIQYDPYIAIHSLLVAKGSMLLAQELDFSQAKIEKLIFAALLHDIGYLAIPKRILNKANKLTSEELKLVKMHPVIASEQILSNNEVFKEYAEIIYNHHEFMDGKGYPNGKKGEQIPLYSQIISIIDTYQSFISNSISYSAIDFEKIIDIYLKNAGIKWDYELITIFTAMLADDKIKQDMLDYKNFFNTQG